MPFLDALLLFIHINVKIVDNKGKQFLFAFRNIYEFFSFYSFKNTLNVWSLILNEKEYNMTF